MKSTADRAQTYGWLPITLPRIGSRTTTCLLLAPAGLFLLVWFAVPLLLLFKLSFTSPDGMFAPYAELLTSGVYQKIALNTLVLSINVTIICLILAYPTAHLMARLKGTWFLVATYCVLFPFWISILIRTFSWMLLLERNGPINDLLVMFHLVDEPLSILFNPTGVYIGMVHVLLPFAVIPIYSSMVTIDRRLLLASDGLGASVAMTFRRIYLPLTLPGIGTGAVFVFLLALGFYITPALLGGLKAVTFAMLIESLVNDRLLWELASAASVTLLVTILIFLLLISRIMPVGQGLYSR